MNSVSVSNRTSYYYSMNLFFIFGDVTTTHFTYREDENVVGWN